MPLSVRFGNEIEAYWERLTKLTGRDQTFYILHARSSAVKAARTLRNTNMQVIRISTGDDGHTHFQELDIDAFGALAVQPGEGPIRFNHGPGDFVMDFHNAPRRQYVMLLSGKMEIETGLGEKRVLVPGDVLVAEDLTGKGHITRGASDEPRVTLSVPLIEP